MDRVRRPVELSMHPSAFAARMSTAILALSLLFGQSPVAAAEPAQDREGTNARQVTTPELVSTAVTVVFREGVETERAAREVVGRARGRGAPESRIGAVGRSLGFAVLEDVPSSAIAQLARDPLVEAVAPDRRLSTMLAETTAIVGADRTVANGLDGRGYGVAIIDTGIDSSHPALSKAVLSEACFVQDSSCPDGTSQQTGPGAAFPPCPGPNCDHGTHVAGIAAGHATSAGAGGVAPGASIVAARVFSDNGDAGTVAVNRALDWIADRATQDAIAVVNISLGYGAYTSTCDGEPDTDATTRLLIRRLGDVGVLTVAAAGNDLYDNAMSFPACLGDVVSVGATTRNDGLTWFSNISNSTDLLAPGDQVHAPIPGGGYGYLSGTSMAAPHVAGAVAALRQRSTSAQPAAIRRAMTQTGTLVQTPAGPKPRLDVHRARLAPTRPPWATATHGDKRATISWGASSRNSGSAITGYRITTSPGGKHVTVGASARSATITGLTNGTRYTFEVRAVNELVRSPARSSNLVIPKPPPPPHGFPDVSKSSYIEHPVRWLKAESITDGYGNTGTYAPDRTVTRAQMAAFLWRMVGEPTGYPHHGFPDVPSGSYYADAVRWLKAEGITDGYGNTGTYAPDRTVTRAQMAAFLHRLARNPTAWRAANDIPSSIAF